MSKKRAFVRYSKQGKIVPGSLILTAGSHPNGPSTWKEVPADLCCTFPPYAIAMVGPGGGDLNDTRAYYSDRDLQNIPGQCSDSSLAIGAKFYLDNQFTTPAADGTYAAVDNNAILFGVVYVVTNGIITDAGCP
jgi:hypothetical protein